MALDLGRRQFISSSLKGQLRRRLGELGGIALAIAALTLALALFTYNPADPSLNTASSARPTNLAGAAGAEMADLLLQGFGAAGFIPVLCLLAWAYRLGTRGAIGRLKTRIVFGGLALPLLAAALALGVTEIPGAAVTWPVPAGIGGAAGAILSNGLSGSVLGRTGAGIALGFGLITSLGCFGYALGFTPGEWHAGGKRAARAAAASVQQSVRGAEAVTSWISPLLQTAAAEQAAPRSSWVPALAEDDEGDYAPPPAPAPALPILPFKAKPAVKTAPAPPKIAPRQERLPLLEVGWTPPSLGLLRPAPARAGTMLTEEALQANARLLENVLQDYGVQGKIVEIRPGPVVTLYELEPAPGIRSARVIGLAEDIARSLSVIAVRIAVVAGRNVIGIEVPNARRETVYFSELLGSAMWDALNVALPMALGKDISGAPVMADLARMPHLLIAGTTGSGKSVGVNAMIMSLLYKLSPEQCRLILIDPKILELSVYDGIPHLLTPVVTEPAKAVAALKWVVREMDRRYRNMSQLSVRNIAGYNERVNEARGRGEVVTRRVQTGFRLRNRQAGLRGPAACPRTAALHRRLHR